MTTIILTSTVNVHNVSYLYQIDPASRIQTYLTSIKKWLYKTNLNIVLVENSGYNFNELNLEKELFNSRFELISFDEKQLPQAKYLQEFQFGKGRHEIFAINYAFNHSKLLKSSTFIIKITGRFYIPEFETFIKNYDLNNYDCIVQNNRERCELVGSHIKNCHHIFDVNIDQEHIENVWLKRTSIYSNILICKIFNIESTQRGGATNIYTTI
jgi:hypothetical protein